LQHPVRVSVQNPLWISKPPEKRAEELTKLAEFSELSQPPPDHEIFIQKEDAPAVELITQSPEPVPPSLEPELHLPLFLRALLRTGLHVEVPLRFDVGSPKVRFSVFSTDDPSSAFGAKPLDSRASASKGGRRDRRASAARLQASPVDAAASRPPIQ
jgi:hypothetical protein